MGKISKRTTGCTVGHAVGHREDSKECNKEGNRTGNRTGNRAGNRVVVDQTLKHRVPRNRIPVQFKVGRRVSVGLRSCTRVSFCCTGERTIVTNLMRFLDVVFNCSYFGGFSRDGIWEAVVSFDKNKCELPYESDLESIMCYMGCNATLNVLDRTITTNVVACYYRITYLRDLFGRAPLYLQTRIREYHVLSEENKLKDSVETYTGRRMDHVTHIQMYNELQILCEQNATLARQLRRVTDTVERFAECIAEFGEYVDVRELCARSDILLGTVKEPTHDGIL